MHGPTPERGDHPADSAQSPPKTDSDDPAGDNPPINLIPRAAGATATGNARLPLPWPLSGNRPRRHRGPRPEMLPRWAQMSEAILSAYAGALFLPRLRDEAAGLTVPMRLGPGSTARRGRARSPERAQSLRVHGPWRLVRLPPGTIRNWIANVNTMRHVSTLTDNLHGGE